MPNLLGDWLQSALDEDIRLQYLSFDFYLPRIQYGLVVGFLVWMFTVCEKGQSQRFAGSNNCHLAEPFAYSANVKEICSPPQMWRSSLSATLFAVQTMCHNTSGTNKLHSGNAVPDADLTAFLVKGKIGGKKCHWHQKAETHHWGKQLQLVLCPKGSSWPLWCVCLGRDHVGGSGTERFCSKQAWSGLGELLLKQDDHIEQHSAIEQDSGLT